MFHEHLAELGELAPDQGLRCRQQVNLVGIAANGEQFLVELRHPMEESRASQQADSQRIGRNDLAGTGLEQMESIVRVMAFDNDVGLMIASADLANRDAGQDRLAIGMPAFARVAQDDDRVGVRRFWHGAG